MKSSFSIIKSNQPTPIPTETLKRKRTDNDSKIDHLAKEIIIISDDEDNPIIISDDEQENSPKTKDLSYLKDRVQQNESFPLSWISLDWSDNDIQDLLAHCGNFKLSFDDIFTLTGRFSKYINDEIHARELVKRNVKLFKFLSPDLRLNQYIVNQVVAVDPSLFKVCLKLSDNKERSPFNRSFLLSLVETKATVYSYFTDLERGNVILASNAVNRNITLFKDIPLEKKNDSKFIDELFQRIFTSVLKRLDNSNYLTDEHRRIASLYL